MAKPEASDREVPESGRLPRSVFVPNEDPREDYRELVDTLLSDGFMAALSILLIPVILIPLLPLHLSNDVSDLFNILDITIILFFVAEYSLKLYLAKDRRAYFVSPWHLLDLTVILLSFVSYLPILALQRSGSAVLLVRLLRLPRVFAVSGRTAGSRLHGPRSARVEEGPTAPLLIQQLDPTHPGKAVILTWEDLERHLQSEGEEWIDLSNIDLPGVRRLSTLLKVQEQLFKFHEVDEIYPQVGKAQRKLIVFLHSGAIRYPESSKEPLSVDRKGFILLLHKNKLVSVSPHGIDLIQRALEGVPQETEGEPRSFLLGNLLGIFAYMVQEYRSIFSEIEVEVARIAGTPKSILPRDFLQRMYQFNKACRRLTSYLVHFKEILSRFASGRVVLEGHGEEGHANFESLIDEMTFLEQIAEDAEDNLQGVTDIYINQSSFETNRILKLLALITALTVLPSTLGSVLGIDGPYAFSLYEVTIVTAIGMSFIFYTFAKLGWLKV